MKRRIDNLGRLVLPREMLNTLGIETGDEVTILIEGCGIKVYKNETAEFLKQVEDIIYSETSDEKKVKAIEGILEENYS